MLDGLRINIHPHMMRTYHGTLEHVWPTWFGNLSQIMAGNNVGCCMQLPCPNQSAKDCATSWRTRGHRSALAARENLHATRGATLSPCETLLPVRNGSCRRRPPSFDLCNTSASLVRVFLAEIPEHCLLSLSKLCRRRPGLAEQLMGCLLLVT